MEKFQIIRNKEITPRDIKQALALDYSCYAHDYHLMYSLCLDFASKNDFIYSMIKIDKQVIAYVNVSPISDEAYERLLGGEIDSFISGKYITSMSKDAELNIYLSSIVVHEKYRNSGYARLLLKDVIDKYLILYQTDNIKIKRIVADGTSDGGVYLLESLGLKFKHLSSRNTKTYELIFDRDTDYVKQLKKMGEKF